LKISNYSVTNEQTEFSIVKFETVTISQRSNFERNSFAVAAAQGNFGKVFLVKNRISNEYYAMKTMKKELVQKQNQIDHVKNEKDLLMSVDCPYIVKL
jgi:serine/threonine protein kinase